MSKTVDQRVVEMQFDNRNFERNVSTTMSTLDKLKSKLNFTGAAKGLENVGTAANKVNMSGLSSGVELVRSRFSALEVMGVTALANITNSAVNAGKRIVSALTIDPIKTGFSEYELKMNSIQVIQANTRGKNTMEDITKALDELNTYADKTIYNFAQMTSNIGKFTAQGYDVYAAANAVKGLANLAAASGASAEDMARATYQMSQALGSTIKLMDWNSLRNANMATVELKNTLMDLARVNGIAIDDMIAKHGSFEQTLSEGWLSGDMFTEAMNIYSGIYSDAELAAKGFTESQIANFKELAAMAEGAATEVKTFTQLWDVLKETAQSGWAQTWELIVGDFDSSKNMFTGMQKYLSGLIDSMSDARNKLLKDALYGTTSIDTGDWEKIGKEISKAGVPLKEFQNALIETAEEHGIAVKDMIKEEKSFAKTLKNGWLTKDIFLKTLDKFTKGLDGVSESTEATAEQLEYFQKLFDEVWRGDWGNGADRIKALTDAGHDYAAIQELVNKHTAGYKLALEDLSDEQLKSVGYTDEQIEAFRKLADEAKKTGTPINELLDSLTRPTGRELLLESFKNILEAIQKPLAAVKEAWGNVFGDGINSEHIYNLIEKFHELTESLIMTTETAEKLETIFEGLFYGGKLLKSVMGTSLVAMMNLLSAVLKLFGTNLLDISEHIAEYIITFGKWVEEHTLFINMMDKVAKIIHAVIEGIDRCVRAFLGLDVIKNVIKSVGDIFAKFFGKVGEGFDSISIDNFVKRINEFFTDIEEWIKGLNDSENLGRDLILGLVNGLTAGIGDVINAVMTVARTVIDTFCTIFGIHSPSRVMFDIAVNLIRGLIEGLGWALSSLMNVIANIGKAIVEAFKSADLSKFINFGKDAGKSFLDSLQNGFSGVWNVVKTLASNLWSAIKKIDFGALFAAGLSVGILLVIKQLNEVLELFGKIPAGVGKMLSGIGDMFEEFGDAAKSIGVAAKRWATGQMILSMAKSIGILALSLALLSKLDPDEMWDAVEVLAALSLIIVGLSVAAIKLDKTTAEGDMFSKNALSILAIAGSLAILGLAMKLISTIPSENMDVAIKGMITMVTGIIAIIAAFSLLNKDKRLQGIDSVGAMIFKMSVAMLAMIAVIKLASMLDGGEVLKGAGVVAMVLAMFSAVVVVSKFAGEHASKAGGMLLKMSLALLIMVGVVALAGQMDKGTINRGLAFVAGVELLFIAIIAVSKLAGQNAGKAGLMMFGMGLSMLMMIAVVKLADDIKIEEVKKGLAAILIMGAMFAALIAVSKFAGANAGKAGLMLMSMSTALLVLTGVLFLMSYIKPDGLARSLAAVVILLYMFERLVKALGGVQKLEGVNGPLIAMTVSIGLLAVAIAALSMLDPVNILAASASLSAVMAAFSLMVKALQYVNTNKGTWLKTTVTLGVMTAVIGALALIISKLSNTTNPQAAIPATVALSALLMSMAFALNIVRTERALSKENMTRTLIMLGSMTAVVGVLAVVISLLSNNTNPAGAIASVTALSALLLAMSASLNIIRRDKAMTKENMTRTLIMLGAMTGVVGALALVIGLLSHNINPQAAIPAAVATSTLLLALATALNIVSTSKSMNPAQMQTILITMGSLIIVVGLLAQIISLMSNSVNADTAIPSATSLSILLLTMAGVTAILSMFGRGSLAAATEGALALIAVVGLLTLAAVAIGGLMNLLSDGAMSWVEEGLDKFILIMGKIGQAVGAIIGGVIGGIGLGIMSTLPTIGTYLTEFMTNAQGFIDGASKVDSSVLTGVGILSGAILALTVVDLIEGISSLLQFGNDLPELGTELSDFMNNAQEFLAAAVTITPEILEGVKTLAGVILTLTAADLIEGIASFFTGGNSLEDFGSQLPQLGSDLNAFATNLGAFSEAQVTAITCAAAAIKTIAQAASEIPNEGGLLGAIMGENGLGAFSSYLPAVGSNIAAFATNLGTFGEDKLASIKYGTQAISELAKAAQNIPNEGGLASLFVGENSIGAFSSYLPFVGSNLAAFANNLGTFGEDQVNSIMCGAKAIAEIAKASVDIPNEGGLLGAIVGENGLGAFSGYLPGLGTNLAAFAANLGEFGEGQINSISAGTKAVKAIAEAAEGLPNEGGFWSKIVGENGLGAFSDKLPPLGTDIAAFAANLGEFGEGQITTIDAAVRAIRALSNLANADLSGAKKHLEGFGEKLVSFGGDLKSFCDDVAGVGSETISTAVSNLKKIVDSIKNISSDTADAADEFGKALKDLGKEGVANFVKEFKTNAAKEDMKTAASELFDKAIEGMEDKIEKSKKAGEKVAIETAKAIVSERAKKKFEDAGKYLVSGFANGIEAKTYLAEAKARAMAAAAAAAAESELRIASPSKVGYGIGGFFGMGFVNAIGDYVDVAYDTSAEMAKSAREGLSAVIRKLNSTLDSEMDTQPTIRPVLDLTSIKSGANTIGSLLNGGAPIDVMANVRSISTMMNQRNQNGTNADVVSAINTLRGELGNLTNTTYQINGVTYDDGSNITDAVRTIVRYAKIGGRV